MDSSAPNDRIVNESYVLEKEDNLHQVNRLTMMTDQIESTSESSIVPQNREHSSWLNQLQTKHYSLANKIEDQKRQITSIHSQLVYYDKSNSIWLEKIPSLKELATAQYEELLTIKRDCEEIKHLYRETDCAQSHQSHMLNSIQSYDDHLPTKPDDNRLEIAIADNSRSPSFASSIRDDEMTSEDSWKSKRIRKKSIIIERNNVETLSPNDRILSPNLIHKGDDKMESRKSIKFSVLVPGSSSSSSSSSNLPFTEYTCATTTYDDKICSSNHHQDKLERSPLSSTGSDLHPQISPSSNDQIGNNIEASKFNGPIVDKNDNIMATNSSSTIFHSPSIISLNGPDRVYNHSNFIRDLRKWIPVPSTPPYISHISPVPPTHSLPPPPPGTGGQSIGRISHNGPWTVGHNGTEIDVDPADGFYHSMPPYNCENVSTNVTESLPPIVIRNGVSLESSFGSSLRHHSNYSTSHHLIADSFVNDTHTNSSTNNSSTNSNTGNNYSVS